MKRRWIAAFFALCLVVSLGTSVLADSIETSVDSEKVIAGAKQLFMTFEGHYDSVVGSDSGAVGMGIMGWRGPKALQLLQMICAAAPALSLEKLGSTLYNEVVNAGITAWNHRTLNNDEKARVKSLIGTEVGIAQQDQLAHDDITLYISYAWKAGIRTEPAIVYYCSVENHYGHGGATKFMKSIRETLGITENDTINSLDEFHNAVLKAAETYSNVASTLNYRKKVYKFIKETLGWDTSGHTDCPSACFTDVPKTGWAHEGIDYVLSHNLFNGTSATTFSPNASMTRGMLVTVLYRLEGYPAATGETVGFSDVNPDAYYAEPIQWAATNGMVNGTSADTFSPNAPVTREQLAAILFRYAKYKNMAGAYDEMGASICMYSDFMDASSYAVVALGWAIDKGLINGVSKDGLMQLDPQGSATRAQVAVILMRYMKNL